MARPFEQTGGESSTARIHIVARRSASWSGGEHPRRGASCHNVNSLSFWLRIRSNKDGVARIVEAGVRMSSQDYDQAGDGLLMTWFQAGDERALETLLRKYEAPLFQFLIGLL